MTAMKIATQRLSFPLPIFLLINSKSQAVNGINATRKANSSYRPAPKETARFCPKVGTIVLPTAPFKRKLVRIIKTKPKRSPQTRLSPHPKSRYFQLNLSPRLLCHHRRKRKMSIKIMEKGNQVGTPKSASRLNIPTSTALRTPSIGERLTIRQNSS